MHWVFAYGSLIYKVDFPYLKRLPASVHGWERRFWQGSHDHRGTPDKPGRVVTLIPSPSAVCQGLAYLIEEPVFEHLDYREKNGYERISSLLYLHDRGASVDGTFYVATQDNPAFLGPAEDTEIARHIAASRGPSGSNADYLLHLAEALRELGEHDEHVTRLEELVKELLTDVTPGA